MQTTLKMRTRVLPGQRIEVTSPELPENAEVDLFVVLPDSTDAERSSDSPVTSAFEELRLATNGAWDDVDDVAEYVRDLRGEAFP